MRMLDWGGNWLNSEGRSRAKGSPELREVEQIDRAVTIVVQVISEIDVADAASKCASKLRKIEQVDPVVAIPIAEFSKQRFSGKIAEHDVLVERGVSHGCRDLIAMDLESVIAGRQRVCADGPNDDRRPTGKGERDLCAVANGDGNIHTGDLGVGGDIGELEGGT